MVNFGCKTKAEILNFTFSSIIWIPCQFLDLITHFEKINFQNFETQYFSIDGDFGLNFCANGTICKMSNRKCPNTFKNHLKIHENPKKLKKRLFFAYFWSKMRQNPPNKKNIQPAILTAFRICKKKIFNKKWEKLKYTISFFLKFSFWKKNPPKKFGFSKFFLLQYFGWNVWISKKSCFPGKN